MTQSDKNLKITGKALELFFTDTELYRTGMQEVTGSISEPAGESAGENPINYTGNNSCGIIMLFDGGEEIKNMPGFAMIKALIENPKAINKKLEELAFVNIRENAGVELSDIIRTLKPKICLLWGKSVLPGLALEMYSVASIEGAKVLVADSAETVEASKELKAKLWNNLKNHI